MAGPEIVAQRAQPRDIGLELGQPYVGRHVDRLEGLFAYVSIHRDPVTRLEALDRGVSSPTFSPDGKLIYSKYDDRSIWVWDNGLGAA